MIDNNKRKSVKGYELKILSAMLNDLSLIPEIVDLFSEDNFSDNHRELFKKICELGKTQKDSTLLIDDLCKLNLTNWNYRELQKLKEVGKHFTKQDVKSAVDYLLNASLPFEQDKNLLSTKNQNNGYIKLVNARAQEITASKT